MTQNGRPEGSLALGGHRPASDLTTSKLGPGERQAGGCRVVPPLDTPHVRSRLQFEDGEVGQLTGGRGVVLRVDYYVLDL